MEDIAKKGTISDRIAALTLLIKTSPFYQLSSLDVLISMAKKKEQWISQLALEALKDLFINDLLPDTPLRQFENYDFTTHNNNNNNILTIEEIVMLWFESELRLRVVQVVDTLELAAGGTVVYFKKQCLETAADFLTHKCEQEGRMLTLLVNKLGDPSSAIGTRSCELLLGLLKRHPSMKLIICKEVQNYLMRRKNHSQNKFPLVYDEARPPSSLS